MLPKLPVELTANNWKTKKGKTAPDAGIGKALEVLESHLGTLGKQQIEEHYETVLKAVDNVIDAADKTHKKCLVIHGDTKKLLLTMEVKAKAFKQELGNAQKEYLKTLATRLQEMDELVDSLTKKLATATTLASAADRIKAMPPAPAQKSMAGSCKAQVETLLKDVETKYHSRLGVSSGNDNVKEHYSKQFNAMDKIRKDIKDLLDNRLTDLTALAK